MNKRGYFVLAGAVLWGTTGTAQALAPEAAQPLAIGTLRLVSGGVMLLAIWLLTHGWKSLQSVSGLPLRPVLIAAICIAAYQVLFFSGVKMTGVAVGTIVGIGSSPVLAGLLGYLFRGEKPGRRWAAATVLATAGCGLLSLAGKDIHIDPLGMLLAIGAGAAYAIFTLVSKGLLEQHPAEMVMAVVFTLGALLLAPLLFTQNLIWLAQPNGIGAVLWLGLITMALAYTLFGKGLQHTPVATAATLTLGEPLTAGTLGVLVLGERLTLQAGLGIALIFSGLLLLSIRKSPS